MCWLCVLEKRTRRARPKCGQVREKGKGHCVFFLKRRDSRAREAGAKSSEGGELGRARRAGAPRPPPPPPDLAMGGRPVRRRPRARAGEQKTGAKIAPSRLSQHTVRATSPEYTSNRSVHRTSSSAAPSSAGATPVARASRPREGTAQRVPSALTATQKAAAAVAGARGPAGAARAAASASATPRATAASPTTHLGWRAVRAADQEARVAARWASRGAAEARAARVGGGAGGRGGRTARVEERLRLPAVGCGGEGKRCQHSAWAPQRDRGGQCRPPLFFSGGDGVRARGSCISRPFPARVRGSPPLLPPPRASMQPSRPPAGGAGARAGGKAPGLERSHRSQKPNRTHPNRGSKAQHARRRAVRRVGRGARGRPREFGEGGAGRHGCVEGGAGKEEREREVRVVVGRPVWRLFRRTFFAFE